MKVVKSYFEIRKVCGFVDMDKEKRGLTTNENAIVGGLLLDDEYEYEVVERLDDASYESYKKGWEFLESKKNKISVTEQTETKVGYYSFKYYTLKVEMYLMVEVFEYEDGYVETDGCRDYCHFDLPKSWDEEEAKRIADVAPEKFYLTREECAQDLTDSKPCKYECMECGLNFWGQWHSKYTMNKVECPRCYTSDGLFIRMLGYLDD